MAISMPTLRGPARHDATSVQRSNQPPRSAVEKMWLAGGAVVGLLLVVIGYFTLIAGQQSDTSAVRAQIDTAHARNSALQDRLTALRAENKNLPSYEAALARANLALPATADVSNFLRTLQSIGSTTSTTVSGVTIGVPTAVTPPAAAVPAGAAASPSPATPGTAAVPSVYSMSITAQVSGSDANLELFLRQLQEVQPRAVLVTEVQEGANANSTPGGSNATGSGAQVLSLSMLAFIAPTHLTLPAAATPATGSASP